MVLPGHIAGGYITARLVLFLTHATFSPAQTLILLIIGTLAGEGPDIDLFALAISRKFKKENKPDDHRLYITHAPIVWVLLSLLVVIIGYFSASPFMQTAGWLILTGSMSHFLFDSIEYGIRWLWPFSNRRFSMKKEPPYTPISGEEGFLSHNINFIIKSYSKWVTFYVEVAVSITALWLAFH